MHLLSSAEFFRKYLFQKLPLGKTVLNGLDQDQDRKNVGPDVGPNCLQSLSADDKSRSWQEKLQRLQNLHLKMSSQ